MCTQKVSFDSGVRDHTKSTQEVSSDPGVRDHISLVRRQEKNSSLIDSNWKPASLSVLAGTLLYKDLLNSVDIGSHQVVYNQGGKGSIRFCLSLLSHALIKLLQVLTQNLARQLQ